MGLCIDCKYSTLGISEFPCKPCLEGGGSEHFKPENEAEFQDAELNNQTVVLSLRKEKPNRPESDHYHTGSVDVWMFMEENHSLEAVEGFHLGNIHKYAARYGKKKGYNRVDIEKIVASAQELLRLHDKYRK